MDLSTIGFYTLTDARAGRASAESPLSRCELVLSSRCNFHCPYCRRVGGDDLPLADAHEVVKTWAAEGLGAIRFSGGEPVLYRGLEELVRHAKAEGIGRIAVSSNGSLPWRRYEALLAAGVNDWSISLDACCASDGDAIAGVSGSWERVVETVRRLAQRCYTTVGVVLTEANVGRASDTIALAASLGVADARVIPAAQEGDRLHEIEVAPDILERMPILAYRIANLRAGKPIRGLAPNDPNRCPLVLDDMAVCGAEHFPCIIYMREGGEPTGTIGPQMRSDRARWAASHDTHADAICSTNCLDVCVDYNRRWHELHPGAEPQ